MVVIKLSFNEDRSGPLQSLIRLRELMSSNTSSLLEDLAEVLAARAKRSFEEGGYPTRWKPSDRVLKEGGKTLIQTQRLKKSFEIGNVENILLIAGPKLIFGSRTPYGKYHMSTAQRTVIPYRPAIQKGPELKSELEARMRDWERRQIKEAGFGARRATK